MWQHGGCGFPAPPRSAPWPVYPRISHPLGSGILGKLLDRRTRMGLPILNLRPVLRHTTPLHLSLMPLSTCRFSSMQQGATAAHSSCCSVSRLMIIIGGVLFLWLLVRGPLTCRRLSASSPSLASTASIRSPAPGTLYTTLQLPGRYLLFCGCGAISTPMLHGTAVPARLIPVDCC